MLPCGPDIVVRQDQLLHHRHVDIHQCQSGLWSSPNYTENIEKK